MKKHYSPSEFESKFQLFCKHHALLSTDSLLVAFSGGADSAVLLTLLQKECQARHIRLTAFHVNHMIRGEEADRDAAFCSTFCCERAIPFVCESVDIPSLAQAGKKGLEETARNERYRLLSEYAEKEGYATIATAHNATDNLETVLFHLVRGMSVHGAGGIHPIRQNLIRPLLPFTKDEILRYAEQENIPFVTDSTNSDTAYTRNHIRHHVLPLLRAINPEAESAVLRFSESARQDDAFLFDLAKEYSHTDDITVLSSLDAAILSRVLLIKVGSFANTEISEKHIHELMEKIHKASQNAFCGSISLPGNLTARITPQTFLLTNTPPPKVPFAQNGNMVPLVPGKAVVFADCYQVRLNAENHPRTTSQTNALIVHLAQDAVCGSLYLRCRQEGDRYVSGGMTRNIKKLLCDAKIPLAKRASLPVLCDDNGILYVPYLPISDRAKPKSASPCYRLEITEL